MRKTVTNQLTILTSSDPRGGVLLTLTDPRGGESYKCYETIDCITTATIETPKGKTIPYWGIIY